jgi:heme A synthase
MSQHHRGFAITVAWTLALLYLGSVVHATESSLACPDWPTCHGTLMPEMEGGVFWEHLHRLVAGGLIVIFAGATYLAWKADDPRRWILKASLAGLALLLVQSVFGGMTVIFLLPDWVSTTHLSLAFLFLALATVLTVQTSPRHASVAAGASPGAGAVKPLAVGAAVLTFVQSVLGALVRHTDSGLVCPDVPQCLGQWIPPFASGRVVLHFVHRLTGIALLIVAIWLAIRVIRHYGPGVMRNLALGGAALTIVQITLGVLAVTTRLGVAPVSLHTLVAASMLAVFVGMATMTLGPAALPAEESAPESERSLS